jgi:hypothetical protein
MNHEYTFVRPLVVAPVHFSHPFVYFYMDQEILDKKVMGWLGFMKEKK